VRFAWLRFLAGRELFCSLFWRGAELEPEVMRRKLKEVASLAHRFLRALPGVCGHRTLPADWNVQASLLCGVALSTTSMALFTR